MSEWIEIPGFRLERGTFDGTARAVYWSQPMERDAGRPGVLVIHELPGITPQVIAFAQRLVSEGFSVALPHIVGVPGRPMSGGYLLKSVARVCVSREVRLLASGEASPVTGWLRALGRELHERAGGAGIGAVGMCFSGNFALTLALDPHLLAPVLSQPSLPVVLVPSQKRGLHASAETLMAIRNRGCPVLGLRFTGDRLVPHERFEALRDALGPLFTSVEIDSRVGNPHGIRRLAHSVLTTDLVDEAGHPTQDALHKTIAFLRERLSRD
jgi:dienelactone hydrolase